MTCDTCGAQNRDDQRFCTTCGAPLGRRCPNCSTAVEPGQRFCGQCGTPLTAPGAAAPASPAAPAANRAPPAPTPASVPTAAPHYELEGERKHLTVLFADIKGSMDMQADLDPEEWAGIMDRFVRLLADGVRRYGGMVDKFTGDGIMALFGAPIALEDHARRACLAALYLVEAIPRYAEELLHTRGLILHVRLGLNSGEVVVGEPGVGKTRLCDEFCAEVAKRGIVVRRTGGVSHGAAVPFVPVLALIRSYFEIHDADSPAEVRAKVRNRVLGLDPELAGEL